MSRSAPLEEPATLTLPVGSPGKVGFLELEFAPVRRLTRLVTNHHQVPFQVLRAMHYDSEEPAMAYVTIISPVGGIVQGDRLRLAVTVRAGSAAHVTTAAATSIYTMETDYGRLEEVLTVEAGAYLEYLPEQLIPHRAARYRQSTRLVVHPEGCLLYGEILLPGRIHMNAERFCFDEVDLRLRALRPDQQLLFADRLLLEPQQAEVRRVGRMGPLEVMTTLYILCPPSFLPELRAKLVALDFQPPGALVGVSELPEGSGLLLRGLTTDTILANRLRYAAWQVARQVLRGTAVPERRRP